MTDRRDVDRLLDDLDDVITTWHGSRDAMRWRPQSTKTVPQPPDFADLGEAMRRFSEAWRPTIEQVTASFGVLVRSFQTPEMQALLAEALEAPHAEMVDCHCFCAVRHPGETGCLGSVPEPDVTVFRISGVDVPICGPCADGPT